MNTQCENFREKFEDYLMGFLSPEESKNLEAHLASCGDCRLEMEKEKRLLGLFQSMERKSAPGILRRNVLDFAQKQKTSTKGWKGFLSGILTLPRLKILTGAAAMVIIVFWCIQIIRAPRPLQKSSVSESRDKRSMELKEQAPDTDFAGLKSEETRLGVTDKDEDAMSNIPAPSSPASEIPSKGGLPQDTSEGLAAATLKSPKPPSGEMLSMENRRIAKTDLSMTEDSLDLKMKAGKAGGADITERLKEFGAMQISQPGMEKGAGSNRYAFAVSYREFERFKKETDNTNIRIINVKPLISRGFPREAKKAAPVETALYKLNDSAPSQQPQAQNPFSASQPVGEAVASKAARPSSSMPSRSEMESQPLHVQQDSPVQSLSGASPTPPVIIVNGSVQTVMPQEQQKQVEYIEPQPAPSQNFFYQDVIQRRTGETVDHERDISSKREQFVDYISSPTTVQAQEMGLRSRLTNEDNLVYVEIEVEPDQ
jgi:hypothetical protein